MSNNLKLINTNTINSKPIRNYIKVKNTGGPKGDTGATGATGPQGPQGPAGQAATINIGETTTLLPGQTATVTNTGTQQNATLNFGIPQGLRGPTGAQGPKGDTGPQGLKGDKGNDGAAASVTVGITNTGEPGSNASVTNLGTSSDAILSFTIPTGSRGPQGQTGPQGPKGEDGKDGEKGDKGDAGQAATVTVGSTTTINPGTSATVTNSGTTSAAILNFGIPRGATGSVKSEVVSELPESGEGDTFYLVNREATTQTATGKVISFENPDNAGDITDFQLDGETSQNGTPTPDAPVAVQTVTGENVVEICGKNLLNLNGFVKGRLDNGVLGYKSNTTALSVNGDFISFTTNANYRGITTEYIAVKPGGTYSTNIPRTGVYGAEIAQYDSAMNFISQGNLYPEQTYSNTTHYIRIYLFLRSAGSATLDSLQLEFGSTASSAYEPYQGQSYEVNLDIGGGKNLLKYSWPYTTGYYDGSGNWSIDYRFACYDKYFEVEPNTAYSFSSSHSNTNMAILWFDENKNWISRAATTDATSASGTSPATAKYARLQVRYETDTIMSYWLLGSMALQFEQGSVSSYEPFVCYELCKIGDYQDYIWNDNGTWKVHKELGKAVIDGTSGTWSKPSTNRFNVDGLVPGYKKESALFNGKCNSYIVLGESTDNGGFNIASAAYNYAMNFTTSSSYDTVRFKNTDYDNLDNFKAYLSSSPAIVYYILSAQNDTTITNAALITQLDNLASAALYSGVNNIFTVTPNEVPTLELGYITYDKYNQNKVYIWNDDLQQWQIIVQ